MYGFMFNMFWKKSVLFFKIYSQKLKDFVYFLFVYLFFIFCPVTGQKKKKKPVLQTRPTYFFQFWENFFVKIW